MDNVKEIIGEFKAQCELYKIEIVSCNLNQKTLPTYRENETINFITGKFKVKVNGKVITVNYNSRKYMSISNDGKIVYNKGEDNKLPYRINIIDRCYKRLSSVMEAVYVAESKIQMDEEWKKERETKEKALIGCGRKWLKDNNLTGFELDSSWHACATFKRDKITIQVKFAKNNCAVINFSMDKISPCEKIFDNGKDILREVIKHINQR